MLTKLQKAALSIRARLNKLFSPQLPLIPTEQESRDKAKRMAAILDERKAPPASPNDISLIRTANGLQNAPEPQSTNTPVQPLPKQQKPRKRKPNTYRGLNHETAIRPRSSR